MPRLIPCTWVLYGIFIVAAARGETIVVAPGESIQTAIDGASDGDTIAIEPGTYAETIDLVGKALAIHGSKSADVTVIDGGGAGTVVRGAPTGAVLSRLTITGGNALAGGGLLVVGSNPVVSACIFDSNEAGEGGAIHVSAGAAPQIHDCLFTSNHATASHGGAIFNSTSSSVIDACAFEGNTAHSSGGAIHSVSGGEPALTACLFFGNSAGQDGGALSNDGSSAAIVGCSFSGNHAPFGGALHSTQGAPQIANSLFYSNDAEYGGGVLITAASDLFITNCTFFGNSATVAGGTTDSGGGIRIEQSAPSIVNSIFWGNGPDQVSEEQSVATLSHCDVQGGWKGAGKGNMNADPLFVDPLSGDFAIQPHSPCVDAGDSGALPLDVVDLDEDGDLDEQIPLDFAGNARIAGSAVDLGPFENVHDECPADIDDDGETGFADLTALLVSWGACPPSGTCAGDLDANGVVGFGDLTTLLVAWGDCPGSNPCPGDLDANGAVGFGDLIALLIAWGQCPTGAPCAADLDGSGEVGFADLTTILTSWGDCPS